MTQSKEQIAELKKELAQLLEAKEDRAKYNAISAYFPDTGRYRRELYPQHLKFLKAGKDFSERAFIAANRVGKSLTGGFEMACHLTGDYPDWWEGKRFTRPISAWAAGITNESTKGIIQEILFGQIGQLGTGLIPKDKIGKVSNRPGVPNAIGYAQIKHASGGWSEVELKSYVQGWETFQGTKKQVIWLDEEPSSQKIFSECITRTAGDIGEEGILYCTFTPLSGYSETVLSFLPGGKQPKDGIVPDSPHRFVICVGWDDVPHLSEQWKEEKLSGYPRHERDARTKGTPTQGSGVIFPIPEEVILVEPFTIPQYWPRAFGLDFGWGRTAAVWGAQDPDSKIVYLYSEHYLANASTPVHASALKKRGEWIFGVGDPHGGGHPGRDGLTFFDEFQLEGVNVMPASGGGPHTKEPRIAKVLTGLESGMIKVFNTMHNWLNEYRIYRRDINGKIVKENDHLMDATQYLLTDFEACAEAYPDEDDYRDEETYDRKKGRSEITGY